jgi:GNAT superfamily N-acetyltransferase
MRVRRVSAQDALQLAELLREIGWFESLSNEPVEETSRRVGTHLAQCLADDSHSVFVAESPEGELVGYGSVHWFPYLFLPGPEGYVSELFVRESARARGVGNQLLHAIEMEAKARGCVRLSLLNLRHRESYQRQFYVKAGWEERREAANFIYLIR